MANKSNRVEEVRLLNHVGEYPETLDREEFRLLVEGFEAYVERRRELSAPLSEEEALLEKIKQGV